MVGGGQDTEAAVQGSWELNDVVAWLEIGEAVVARAVGGGGANECPCIGVEVHDDALDAGFICGLRSIFVQVFPNKVPKGREGGVVACVDGGVVFGDAEHNICGAASGLVGIAIGIVCTLIWLREDATCAEAEREADAVGAGVQVVEDVVAGAICDRGADGCAAAVMEGHSDAFDAGFATILDAIAVEVFEDKVTQAGLGTDEACVESGVHFPGHQCHVDRGARGGVGIAIQRIIATCLVGGGEDAAICKAGGEFDRVGAGLQFVEEVEAGAIRFSGADGGAAGIEEGHSHIGDAWLSAVLLTIAVEVLPDVIAQGREWVVVTCIDGAVMFCDSQGDIGSDAGCIVWIAVCSSSASEGGGKDAMIRQAGWELHCIVTRLEIVEEVVAAAVGLSGAEHCATAIQKGYRHVGDAWFAAVLLTIVVLILPHVITEGCERADIARIPG